MIVDVILVLVVVVDGDLLVLPFCFIVSQTVAAIVVRTGIVSDRVAAYFHLSGPQL